VDGRDLIHPMTAADLVESACVVAIREREIDAEAKTSIWQCTSVEHVGLGWPNIDGAQAHPDARLVATFHDRQTGERVELQLKAKTPLLFTRIAI
jgi:hypothetical protein